MRAEVLAWMQAQRMTEPGDTVVCAVSGGADSVCMLHVLLSLQDTLGIRHHRTKFVARKLFAILTNSAMGKQNRPRAVNIDEQPQNDRSKQDDRHSTDT